ncbi:MAG: hypothetical protein IH849_06595 [Acidobacteria bacterium]|nr:hypothetical protein [Acidobacteriota bacterium]
MGTLVALVSAAGVALAASAAAPGAHPQEQRPAYRASVEIVRLHAAVLDGDGNPVTGLTARDFVVVDDGVEHDVAFALSPGDTPIDVALLFDQSDSIRQSAPTVKRDARAFLDALGPGDCAFVLPFQHRIGPGIWGPPADPSLLQIIDLARLEGGTSFNDALMVGLAEVQQWNVPDVLAAQVVTEYQQPAIAGGVGINFGPPEEPLDEPEPEGPGFSRADLPFRVFGANSGCGGSRAAGGGASPDRRKALVVLSDGVDTTSAHTFGELLGFVHQTDVPIFPVGIGLPGGGAQARSREAERAARIAESRLETLAESTGGKYIVGSGSETRLREAYDEIVTILRGSYLLGYYPQNRDESTPAQTHEHHVEVKLRRSGLRVFARSEYYRSGRDTHTARSALRRGAELALDGDLNGALAAARRAVFSDPGLWDGSFLQAAVLWMQHDPGAALAPLRQALWLEPGVAATQQLAWQLSVELGDLESAWDHAIRAQLAGADMDAEMELLGARSVPPEDLEARLNVPRVFVEGPRSDDPEHYARLAAVVRALSRAASDSPLLGLVRYPLDADYFLYIEADDPDRRSPGALESRLELYNYADRRLWRQDMDIDDLASEQAIADAVRRALAGLEEWLTKER